MGEPGSFTRPPGFDARTASPADARLLGDEPNSIATVLVRGMDCVDGTPLIDLKPAPSH